MALTQKDTAQLKTMFEIMLEVKLEAKLEEKFNEKLGLIPTREEFYKSMDEIMTELKTIQQEQLMNTHRINNHDVKFQEIDQILLIN